MSASVSRRAGCCSTTFRVTLEQGTVTAILGRSGSGKTTLLRTVNRMVEPTAGAVLVDGRDVREANLIALRRGMGYVIQETGLFPHFTVERNVGLVLEAEGRPRAGTEAAEPGVADGRLAWTRRALASAIRTSFPAGSGSASGWRARWPPIRPFC